MSLKFILISKNIYCISILLIIYQLSFLKRVQLKVMFSCLVGWVERERNPPNRLMVGFALALPTLQLSLLITPLENSWSKTINQ
ncbi:hypothetical protein BGP_1615 [Beggiatoa sp. PS]|nr:hypothetical protein BGP_1615 [Beggiatoa sp. PS]